MEDRYVNRKAFSKLENVWIEALLETKPVYQMAQLFTICS